MLPQVEKHIIDTFTIDMDITDPAGNVYSKGTQIEWRGDYDLIVWKKNAITTTLNTKVTTRNLNTPMDAVTYLNYLRCAAGISYVTENDVTPKFFGLPFLEANSVLEVCAKDEIKKINYNSNGRITTQLIIIEPSPWQIKPVTPETVLRYIQALDNSASNNNTKNTMGITQGPTNIGPFNSMPVTVYTCKNQVTDMMGKSWTMRTQFKKITAYDVEATSFNALGGSQSIVIRLNLHPTNPGYPTAEEYIADIMARDGSVIGGAVNKSGIHIQNSDGTYYDNVPDEYSDTDVNEKKNSVPKTPIKKVYCPYNADLIVYDVHNKRVDELCGILTEEKFYALIKRINDDTKFDGFEYFKCAACELGAIKEGPATDNDFDALDAMKEAAAKAPQVARKIPNGSFAAPENGGADGEVSLDPFSGIGPKPSQYIQAVNKGASNIIAPLIGKKNIKGNSGILSSKSAGNMNPFEAAISKHAKEKAIKAIEEAGNMPDEEETNGEVNENKFATYKDYLKFIKENS